MPEQVKKLFVGGLPWGMDDKGLKEVFAPYGVVEAKIIMDRETNRSRGFGFVTLTTAEGARQAKQDLDQSLIQDRRITVTDAKDQARRESGQGAPGPKRERARGAR